MAIIRAVFENGVIRPKQPVDLPEATELEVELRVVTPPHPAADFADVHAILARRHRSGQHDGAARHDEHQP